MRFDVEERRTGRWRAAAFVFILGSVSLVGCGSDEQESTDSSRNGALRSSVLYRTPSCGCCKSYAEYLRKHGVEAATEVIDDLATVRADNAVPDDAASCHTVVIDGYAIEGHVPVEAIDKLLAERPDVDGIGIPGMPTNAPGMGDPDGNPLEVVSFKDGRTASFVTL